MPTEVEMTDSITDTGEVSPADLMKSRKCVCCGQIYSVGDYQKSAANYFQGSDNYANGCWTRCLSCWLGVGPNVDAEDDDLDCNVLRDCGDRLGPGTHLVLMPIARTTLDIPIRLPLGVRMYPAETVDYDVLNVQPNSDQPSSLAEHSSALSRVDKYEIGSHVTMAFLAPFNWDEICSSNHKVHLEFIRQLSETADKNCFNVIKYRQCQLGNADSLPGRVGQLDSNHMMAGALLYNPVIQKARIIGGAAFTHTPTRGLGLPISTPNDDDFPQDGEVGKVVDHALSLYALLLETESETSKFVQALSLLEFLADPDSYTTFSEVKRIVARYVATSPKEYDALLKRFEELTSKKDETTGTQSGYRTRIVHIGDRLGDLVPGVEDRLRLFEELDSYIRPVIDHMIAHSGHDWAGYMEIREEMRPFDRAG